MAKPDHKALARPPNPLGGTSPPSLGRPRRSSDSVGKSRLPVAQRVTAIRAAMNDIATLVIESTEARDAVARGDAPRSGCWPLPQVCAQNLVATIRFLDHYTELLSHEPMTET